MLVRPFTIRKGQKSRLFYFPSRSSFGFTIAASGTPATNRMADGILYEKTEGNEEKEQRSSRWLSLESVVETGFNAQSVEKERPLPDVASIG